MVIVNQIEQEKKTYLGLPYNFTVSKYHVRIFEFYRKSPVISFKPFIPLFFPREMMVVIEANYKTT